MSRVLPLLLALTCLLQAQAPRKAKKPTPPANRTAKLRQDSEPDAAVSNEQRVALVIGNGAYSEAPLKNPAKDARDMASALRKCGFNVSLVVDADRRQMYEAIRAFGQKITGGGVGLFYYAGHGIAFKGANYLIPVRTEINSEDEVPVQALDANAVLAKMDAAKNRLNILILDACRNNPFARSWRSASRGLAQMEAPSGSFVAFATAPGATASDGQGQNGLYTQHLLEALKQPGLSVEQVFKRVRVGVKRNSQNQQVPWDSSSLTGEFYFVPGSPAPAAPISPAPAAPASTPAPTPVATAAPAHGSTALDLLFPLYGVTLGRTTVAEMKRLGHESTNIDDSTGKPYHHYVIQGMDFWYHDSNVAKQTYSVHSEPMPPKWAAVGFDWQRSYDGWLELFRSFGWQVQVKKEPFVETWKGRESLRAELEVTSGPVTIELNFDVSGKTSRADAGTLYSLRVTAEPSAESASTSSMAAEPSRGTTALDLLFPLYGVTLGRTTMAELKRMGAESTSIDGSTGKPYHYYVIQGMNFWYHDANVAKQTYSTCGDPIPPKWAAAGFDWQRSYDGWLELFRSFGWQVQVKKGPFVETWKGRESLRAELEVTSGPITIELDFDYSGKTSRADAGTLYSLRVTGTPSAEGASTSSMAAGPSRGNTALDRLFPLYGVTLGQTTVAEMKRLGQRTTVIDDSTGQPYQYYVINNTDFWYFDKNVANVMHLFSTSGPMPPKWGETGFSWELSYDEWMDLCRSLGWQTRVTKEPSVEHANDKNSLSAEVQVTSGPIHFTLDFRLSGRTSRRDPRTLYSLFMRYE